VSKEVSKTQIDRLGDRLRKGHAAEADLRLLDSYRRSFAEAYEAVLEHIQRWRPGIEVTGRPAKSTSSIVEKLHRESIRLTQIQDIAGCRLIVRDAVEQDSIVKGLSDIFDHVTIVDRRERPTHGYRAVHVIVTWRGKMIEIQVRTRLQHLWAELSEKFSDVVDSAIKYGGGTEEIREVLTIASTMVGRMESMEKEWADLQARFPQALLPEDLRQKATAHTEYITSHNQMIAELLRDLVARITRE
jgi:putative GTP pyrophosphokinase